MIATNRIAEAQAELARDQGIRQASEAAGEHWRLYALGFVESYLKNHRELFVDDLWKAGLETPVSPRALGGVIQQAASRGWMKLDETDDGVIAAKRSATSNKTLKPIWRSLIFEQLER